MLAQRNRTSSRVFEPTVIAPQAESVPVAGPAPRATQDPKQRRLMAVALVLLLVALAGLLYRDRDFWFPDTAAEEAEIDQPTETATVATAPAAQPRPVEKSVAPPATTSKINRTPVAPKAASTAKHASTVKASAAKIAAAPKVKQPSATAAATQPAVPSSPVVASANRTVLPPLEVEVVAGDNHSTVRPGSNSVHVDLKPGSPPRVASSTPAIPNTETAARITTNAAEHVQMSADTASAVTTPVKPGYPLLARQMKVQGSVILQALIGKDGVIQDLRVLSGPQILASAAQDAVRQWHFRPHYVNSEAVETQAKITVNFTISTN